MSPAARFWGSAAGVAAVFAALVPVLTPYRAMGLDPAEDRVRIWLLVVFTAGVMGVLFGLGALLAGPRRALGIRDVVEAGGSVDRARERARERAEAAPPAYTSNFAAWTVATGVMLIGVYFVLFAALGRN
ncbi:MAG TPA: hypothetical protein VFQ45_00625 [Longimicrobium sp.]|nr:hypothetical protein [Longimicrobium sp.]